MYHVFDYYSFVVPELRRLRTPSGAPLSPVRTMTNTGLQLNKLHGQYSRPRTAGKTGAWPSDYQQGMTRMTETIATSVSGY